MQIAPVSYFNNKQVLSAKSYNTEICFGNRAKNYDKTKVLELMRNGCTNEEVVDILGVPKFTPRNLRYKNKKELNGFETSKLAAKVRARSFLEKNSEKIITSIQKGISLRKIAKEMKISVVQMQEYLMSSELKPMFRKSLFSSKLNEKIDFIQTKLAKGVETSTIAKEMGVTKNAVNSYLNMAEVSSDFHKQTLLCRYKDVMELIIEKYLLGEKVSQIARDLNIADFKVNTILLHLGLKIAKRQ